MTNDQQERDQQRLVRQIDPETGRHPLYVTLIRDGKPRVIEGWYWENFNVFGDI